MKKIILGLGAVAATIAPVVAVVSCNVIGSSPIYHDLKTPAKGQFNIKIEYNLDNIAPEQMMEYFKTQTQNEQTKKIDQIRGDWSSASNDFNMVVNRFKNTGVKVDASAVHEYKQALVNMIYAFGDFSEIVNVTYKGVTTELFNVKYDLTSPTVVEEIRKCKVEDLYALMLKIAEPLKGKEIMNIGMMKALTSSNEYIAWYLDKVTTPKVDATALHFVEAKDPRDSTKIIASAPLNPTNEDIDNFFKQIAEFQSQLLTELLNFDFSAKH